MWKGVNLAFALGLIALLVPFSWNDQDYVHTETKAMSGVFTRTDPIGNVTLFAKLRIDDAWRLTIFNELILDSMFTKGYIPSSFLGVQISYHDCSFCQDNQGYFECPGNEIFKETVLPLKGLPFDEELKEAVFVEMNLPLTSKAILSQECIWIGILGLTNDTRIGISMAIGVSQSEYPTLRLDTRIGTRTTQIQRNWDHLNRSLSMRFTLKTRRVFIGLATIAGMIQCLVSNCSAY
jgi:hypothetical protein